MSKFLCVRLKELRLEKGLTKGELAFKLGISFYKLTRLENLTLKANLYEIGSLTYFFNANIDYIIAKSSVRIKPVCRF